MKTERIVHGFFQTDTQQSKGQMALIFISLALIIMLIFMLMINTAYAADNMRKTALVKQGMTPLNTVFLTEQMYTPVIALTFDDGPDNEFTPQLLDILNERGAKATFFILGEEAEKYPQIVKAAYDSGHQIENHSYDHPRFTKIDKDELQYQINTTNDIIYGITGEMPAYVRPTYGAINKTVAEQIGYPMMLWTLDPRDWEAEEADIVYNNIMANVYNGAVIVLHDKNPSTHEALKMVIDELQAKGWKFVTLDEYYQYFNMQPQPHKVYHGTQAS